ncbi:hypothetical protein AVEN_255267-1 [Araneus ventricosus]|uniref:Uncharacterized protein n=1 Tax=Araneus ventricosus TaxID=182803 RepID=A0A4Y2BDD9_ARAVE|nr:hypothetical protein AVEN_255267-1 [Araneus ventricosus]
MGYHNGNIIEYASVYPVEIKGLIDGSNELSMHFKNNIKSYSSSLSFASNVCTDYTAYRCLRCLQDDMGIGTQVLRGEGHEASENATMYFSDDRFHISQHRGRYNTPKTNEIAMLFRSSRGIPPNNLDVCIYPRQRELSRISTINPNCDPMT